jgi:hypothetical protein
MSEFIEALVNTTDSQTAHETGRLLLEYAGRLLAGGRTAHARRVLDRGMELLAHAARMRRPGDAPLLTDQRPRQSDRRLD